MTERPSKWIMDRADEMARENFRSTTQKMAQGIPVAIPIYDTDENEYVRKFKGFFCVEAVMEWADHFAADTEETIAAIGVRHKKLTEALDDDNHLEHIGAHTELMKSLEGAVWEVQWSDNWFVHIWRRLWRGPKLVTGKEYFAKAYETLAGHIPEHTRLMNQRIDAVRMQKNTIPPVKP